jgi:hypothetical protein
MNKIHTTKRLTAFLALSPDAQWRAFADWVARRPKALPYTYSSTTNCPKAQFGRHLIRGSKTLHSSCGIVLRIRRNSDRDIIEASFLDDLGSTGDKVWDVLQKSKTFGELSAKLKQIL